MLNDLPIFFFLPTSRSSNLKLNGSFGDRELLASVPAGASDPSLWFPLRGERGN